MKYTIRALLKRYRTPSAIIKTPVPLAGPIPGIFVRVEYIFKRLLQKPFKSSPLLPIVVVPKTEAAVKVRGQVYTTIETFRKKNLNHHHERNRDERDNILFNPQRMVWAASLALSVIGRWRIWAQGKQRKRSIGAFTCILACFCALYDACLSRGNK